MDKVESVQIDQSILGRMLDYGDVTILGTGEGFETLRTIASPIELRNSITGTTHKSLGCRGRLIKDLTPAGTLIDFVVLIVAVSGGGDRISRDITFVP